MRNKTINEQGAINLVQGIVDRAVKDFMVTKPGTYQRQEVEEFFLSDHFEMLTGTNGSGILEQLRKQYEEKQKKGKSK